MKKSISFALIGAGISIMAVKAADVDCLQLSLEIKRDIAADQSKILEIVSKQVASSPSCSCEIVKSAIEASNPSPEAVAAIVEAASNAAPDQMRLVSQCAVAMAPDSLANVQAVLAKLDPNAGESGSSSKDSKDSKAAVASQTSPGEVADQFNPLDFPGQGPVGPSLSGPAGYAGGIGSNPNGGPSGPGLFPPTPPIIIAFPVVTQTDF